MVKGKDRMQWWHTAALMALTANCHRDARKRPRPYSPKEFHPEFAPQFKLGTPVSSDTIHAVISAYVTPERSQAAEQRAADDVDRARKLAETQRHKLRLVA